MIKNKYWQVVKAAVSIGCRAKAAFAICLVFSVIYTQFQQNHI